MKRYCRIYTQVLSCANSGMTKKQENGTGKYFTSSRVPSLIIFDLDRTLWYPEMDSLFGASFQKHPETGVVTDNFGAPVRLFTDVHQVLHEIATNPIFQSTKIAVASSTIFPERALECMRLVDVVVNPREIEYDEMQTDNNDFMRKNTGDPEQTYCSRQRSSLDSYIRYKAIYPKNKKTHFEQLQQESGVPYEEMLFFDNEFRNIRDVKSLGVKCAYCPNGLDFDIWLQGMNQF